MYLTGLSIRIFHPLPIFYPLAMVEKADSILKPLFHTFVKICEFDDNTFLFVFWTDYDRDSLKVNVSCQTEVKNTFFFQTVHKYIFSCFHHEYNNRNHEVHFAKVRDSHQNMICSDDIKNWFRIIIRNLIQINGFSSLSFRFWSVNPHSETSSWFQGFKNETNSRT